MSGLHHIGADEVRLGTSLQLFGEHRAPTARRGSLFCKSLTLEPFLRLKALNLSS
jgi:hypothetical protein